MIRTMPKPEGVSWTDDQWDAIAMSGSDMLVAAAAGSGKTAVLVERIIRRISDAAEPVDVDRLLVATFTNAAAAEMKQRIREALSDALTLQPESDHLRRQLALMGKASITTLHSFCQDVIRKYYQSIQLDPGFRIANETETQLMRQELLEELLEDWYGRSEEESPFWKLAESFGGERSDAALHKLIQQLYDFSRSQPWPDHWLRQTAGMFAGDPEAFRMWTGSLLQDARLQLEGALDLLAEMEQLCSQPGGPEPYLANVNEDADVIRYLLEAARHSWGRAYEAFQTAAFGRLKTIKKGECDEELQAQAKSLRERAKKAVTALKEELFARSSEQYAEELAVMSPLMDALAELTVQFGQSYKRAKLDKGLVDFSDLEHYCLQILCASESEPGRVVPSQAALDYREQFVEVLLDEYQDTNSVQETIVELISKPAPGNRFMVGDVKQSIYKFRLAEPGLFLDKYRTYRTGGGESGCRIDLARNFRSRKQVVDGVNFIFRQLMHGTVGEIEYDERAELAFGAGYYPESPEDLAVELIVVDNGGEAAIPGFGGDDESPDSEAEAAGTDEAGDEEEDGDADGGDTKEAPELDAARLEARLVAERIRRLVGLDGSGAPPFQVLDKRSGGMRGATFRDIVVLLRSPQAWAPVFTEELKLAGIPSYAELATGYFTATEVEIMMSLLKIIDNPYQDIPLASVLRSPIVGLAADELAQIRLSGRGLPFYDAVKRAAGTNWWQGGHVEGADEADGGDRAPESEAEAAERDERGSGEAAEAPVTDDPMSGQVDVFELLPAEDALKAGVKAGRAEPDSYPVDAALRAKLQPFLRSLAHWRAQAKQVPLGELLWRLLRETGYYDFVGGMPGGVQRQANLRALYDRARQFESTSLRGLFRFLRFVERMRESGGDLGAARALGEQEDVVRIMSIHKSKGLEFPVVFISGTGKMFNDADLKKPFLLHKELGFGPRFVDTELRIGYPSLPSMAIQRRIRLETLAEEMRVLYVALTRPREKMILTGTVRGLDKAARKWSRTAEAGGRELPEFELAKARCYLDWIGPAVMRHPGGAALREAARTTAGSDRLWALDPSVWTTHIVLPEQLASLAEAAPTAALDHERLDALRKLEPAEPGGHAAEVEARLSWSYPYPEAHMYFSKTSVTELKRLGDFNALLQEESEEPYGTMGTLFDETARTEDERTASVGEQASPPADYAGSPTSIKGGYGQPGFGAAGSFGFASAAASMPAQEGGLLGPLPAYRPSIVRRPRFLERKSMTSAERGTLYHAVMQHIPLSAAVDESTVRATVARMLDRQLMTAEQSEAVDASVIAAFFRTELGVRLLRANVVRREIPFSYALTAADVYPGADAASRDETIMIQGVIDCLFEEPEGLILLDFKTDSLKGRRPEAMRDVYKLQLDLYARAIEHIWRKPVAGKYLYLFDGAHVVDM